MSYQLEGTTTLDSILTNVKEELGLFNTTAQDFYLRRLIKEGEKEIFSLDQVEKRQEVIDITNNQAKLPCNFVMFNELGGVRFYSNGSQTSDHWYAPVSSGATFFRNNNTNNCGYWETIQRIGNYLYIDGTNNDTPLQLEVSGLFLKVNADGTCYIPEMHNRPLTAYACYKFIRSRLNSQYGFTLGQLQDYKIEWSNGKKAVQAKSKMPDALQKAVINRGWNHLLAW